MTLIHARHLCCLLSTAILLLAVVLPSAGPVVAQEVSKTRSSNTKTDAQLIEALAAPKYEKADAAVDEIMRRGVRMIPLLIQKKGDQRFFRGWLARDPLSATGVAAPFKDPKKNKWLIEEGKLVTVEVAALYLITAIYYDSLDIAHSPYLADFSLPEIERKMGNKKPLVERAWKATVEWSERLAASDIATLRAADDVPLWTSKVRFW